MMRSDIAQAIKAMLISTGDFATVCGLGCDKPAYPLARVWIPGCSKENLDNTPQARLDLRVAIQIETWLERDNDGKSVDGPLYDLVDTVFSALHGQKLPGRGSQRIAIYDFPGLREYKNEEPAAYLLQASIPVIPTSFSLS